MSWFKENQFIAGLVTITVLVAAALVFLGLKSGDKLEEVQGTINEKTALLQRDKNLDPFPTPENAEAKKKALAEVIKRATEVQEKLKSISPSELENIPGKDFSEKLVKTVDQVKAKFQGRALPDRFSLGFEEYTGSLPKEEATGALSYQLSAFEYIFEQLADAGVSEVRNLYREKLPPEMGEPWPNEQGKRGAGNKRQSRSPNAARGGRAPRGAPAGPIAPTFEALPEVANRMPFELTFRATEKVAREVVDRLGNSDEHFVQMRMVRVVNPTPIPSAGKKAEKKEDVPSDFGDFNLPSDDAEATGDLLEKVSGGEELVIFIRADLLLFLDGMDFPELK